ncbi:MAG TPA: hypothetical protein VGD59_04790 [Acidisarcina sp.]
MVPYLRSKFNREFRPATYQSMLAALQSDCGAPVSFRVAETPCFFPAPLLKSMAVIGRELTERLVSDREYLRQAGDSIPAAYRASGESPHPHFMTVDFGLVREPSGELTPRLVELQAFPSVFAFQLALSHAYRRGYGLEPTLDPLLGGHTESSFWELLSRVILRGHDPENVVLMEIDPYAQKTLPDFLLTSARLGIRILDVRDVIPVRSAGKPARLFYARGSSLVPIHRIYNRTIVDELIRKQVALPFEYGEELDVEWAGHPNWYFQISKFSIPYLDHWAVPPAVFLDKWLEDRGRLPQEPEALILKPLFSFAGQGIRFGPTAAELESIPPSLRRDYLLQQRVRFEPVIETPWGLTQAEIRVMYVWPDEGQLEPVITLIRLGRGMMMGVDHNREQEWVGASASFSPQEDQER